MYACAIVVAGVPCVHQDAQNYMYIPLQGSIYPYYNFDNYLCCISLVAMQAYTYLSYA